MNFKDSIKADFEDVFLDGEFASDFTISRAGSVAGTERGIEAEYGLIQFKTEADIRAGDILKDEDSGNSYRVVSIGGTFDGCLDVYVARI